MRAVRVVPKVGWINGHGEETSFDVRTIYELLEVIRRKWGLFIGVPSLTALDSFLYGFRAGLESVGNPFDDEDPSFHGFHDWIATRFGYRESTSGWKNMLLQSVGDEPTALERFFTELDEYRRAHAGAGDSSSREP